MGWVLLDLWGEQFKADNPVQYEQSFLYEIQLPENTKRTSTFRVIGGKGPSWRS
jgi:hypothetical protein